MKYFGLLSQTHACLKTFWQKDEIRSKGGAGDKHTVGTALLLSEGLTLESSPMEWVTAEALKLLMVFSEWWGYHFVGERC